MSQEARELGEIAHLARFQGMLPYIEDAIGKMQQAVVARAKTHQTNGTLTGDLALALWMEYLANEKLLSRLGSRERAAQGTAARLAPLLTPPGSAS